MATMIPGDSRKDCCRVPENLEPHQERPDLTITKCHVCGCRHFELTVDPGVYFAKGAPVGG